MGRMKSGQKVRVIINDVGLRRRRGFYAYVTRIRSDRRYRIPKHFHEYSVVDAALARMAKDFDAFRMNEDVAVLRAVGVDVETLS